MTKVSVEYDCELDVDFPVEVFNELAYCRTLQLIPTITIKYDIQLLNPGQFDESTQPLYKIHIMVVVPQLNEQLPISGDWRGNSCSRFVEWLEGQVLTAITTSVNDGSTPRERFAAHLDAMQAEAIGAS